MLLQIVIFLVFQWSSDPAIADPQNKLLNIGCSTYNASNAALFYSNLNATFSDVRSQISSGELTAISQQPRSADPVFTLFFCRSYLSSSDCLECLTSAISIISSCGVGTGGRTILDGCTLRYESTHFFEQGTLPGNTALCGNASEVPAGFGAAATALISDLSSAVPNIPDYSAAAEKDGVYGAAQCANTVSQDTCSQCLQVAYTNIKECLPTLNGRAIDAACYMRYSNLAFFSSNQTMDLSPFLRGSGSSGKNIRFILWGVAAGVVALFALSFATFLLISKLRKRREGWNGDILGATELQGPLQFRYIDLKVATTKFSQENKLGEGGFGEVFKGTLKNGNVVAVKRLAIAQTEVAKASFQSEVKLISNVHHRNLVRLLGCCGKHNDLLLVYEYMPNGSLDRFIFGEKTVLLNWKQRFDIIVGMARGISYLHHEFHVCIIHRDIKPSNILLDENFQPKIADFGLARLLPGDQTHLSTKFAGTLGYTAPEYAIHGQLTEKVDTYSFGVVILEIISGRKNSDLKLEPSKQFLLEWVWKLYEEEDLTELIDKCLDPDDYEIDQVKRVMKIALLCIQSVVAARPTMAEVVILLQSQSDIKLEPARPIYMDSLSRTRAETSSAWSVSPTQATVSVTQFSAR